MPLLTAVTPLAQWLEVSLNKEKIYLQNAELSYPTNIGTRIKN